MSLQEEPNKLSPAEEDALLTSLYEELTSRRGLSMKQIWRARVWNFTIWSAYALKRFCDIIIASLALIILSPLFLVTIIAIKLTDGGPAFFTQVRVGRDGKNFNFYKFRSMYVDAEARKAALAAQNESADGVLFKMKNDPRITPIGHFIRKFSIDELPQLWNVLKGDMSLVGPRPPLPAEVQLYSLEERKRLNVIPGLTCLWQISGRSDIPFKEQVRLDKEYIRTHGILNDLMILLKTIPAIISGKGAY